MVKYPLNVIDCGTAGRDSLRVVVIEWNRLFAGAIRRVAGRCFPRAAIVAFNTANEALVALRKQPAALALVGLMLPDLDGLDLIVTITGEGLAQRLLVISGRRDERTCELLRELRIGRFNPTSEDSGALCNAIRAAMDEPPRAGVPPDGAKADGNGEPPHLALTRTELVVFLLIGGGYDEQQAADRLGMNRNTLHTHLRRIMRKLRVQTRTEAMREAMRRGYVRFTPEGVMYPGSDHELAEHARRVRERRARTDDGRRTTDDGRRTTDDGRRTTDDGRRHERRRG